MRLSNSEKVFIMEHFNKNHSIGLLETMLIIYVPEKCREETHGVTYIEIEEGETYDSYVEKIENQIHIMEIGYDLTRDEIKHIINELNYGENNLALDDEFKVVTATNDSAIIPIDISDCETVIEAIEVVRYKRNVVKEDMNKLSRILGVCI